MQDILVTYLKTIGRPVSTVELCTKVFKMTGGGLDKLEKILTGYLADNPCVSRDAQGLWLYKPAEVFEVAPEFQTESKRYTIFDITFYRSPDQNVVPAGLSGRMLDSGEIVDNWTGSLPVRRAGIPDEFYEETGIPAPDFSTHRTYCDILIEFATFCHDTYLVCYHYHPLMRILQELFQRYCFETLENPVISLRTLAERLYPRDKFVNMEDMLAFFKLPYVASHEADRKIETITCLFLELETRLEKIKISGADSIFQFQSDGSRLELDFEKLAIDEEFFLTLPESPGIYLMENRENSVFYVGKAKNLARRLHSHFMSNTSEPEKQTEILKQLYSIRFEAAGSELEALLKEFRLIKLLNPSLNRQLDAHDRANITNIAKDFVLILSSTDIDCAEIFVSIHERPVYQERLARKNPDFQHIRKIIKRAFLKRKLSYYLAPEEEMENHILRSWAAREWDHIRSISLHETKGTTDVLRILKTHLESPEPLSQKITIQ